LHSDSKQENAKTDLGEFQEMFAQVVLGLGWQDSENGGPENEPGKNFTNHHRYPNPAAENATDLGDDQR